MNPVLSMRRGTGPSRWDKDQVLDEIAHSYNVAQFASFGPDLRSRFSRIKGLMPNAQFVSVHDAAAALLQRSSESSANIRSFSPLSFQSREFLYGIESADEVVTHVTRLAAEGLYTIVNETIDIKDGGVSGVVLDNVIEFSPNATPRCVEEPDVAALPRELGIRMLETVYGFRPSLESDGGKRVEFSVHPMRRGWRDDHTIVWEMERIVAPTVTVVPSWPNRFSRHIGDKVYGLLIGCLVGLDVPRTLVIARRVAPFAFGRATGTAEVWTRTSPADPQPGRFSTTRGWSDPFALFAREDPLATELASVLAQEGVEPSYSGALVSERGGRVTIEGVAGTGDAFMMGKRAPEQLPRAVLDAVTKAYQRAAEILGPVKLEWCLDQARVWILQLHCGVTESVGRTIVPGDAAEFRRFHVERGITEFREFVADAAKAKHGVVLVGRVGTTSHFGDILRRAAVPSRVEY